MNLKGITLGLFFAVASVYHSLAQTKPGLLTETKAIGTGAYTGIHSVLISKNGQTVYKHYFNGFTTDSVYDSRSSFKSITTCLSASPLTRG